MEAGELEHITEFLATHKNIAKIFPETWFESELRKSDEEMHLLAKQFTFDDCLRDRSISNHLFDHLEENLEILRKEIQSKRRVSKNLKDTREYINSIGQIEIAALFKKMGFDIELEPHIPRSIKKSDIKIVMGEFAAYVEVRTLHDREGTIVCKSDNVEISTINNHSIPTIKEIIIEKTQQLSEHHPGILVINLDEIPRTLHFKAGFYESSKECPIISGMLLYRHYYNSEGCQLFIEFFGNPYANKPLPDSIEKTLEVGGVKICTWTKEEIAIVEESAGK